MKRDLPERFEIFLPQDGGFIVTCAVGDAPMRTLAAFSEPQEVLAFLCEAFNPAHEVSLEAPE